MLHADADPGAIARAASAGTVTASSFARRAFMLSFPPSLNPTWVMLGAGGRAISHTAAGETSGFASPPHGGFAVASARGRIARGGSWPYRSRRQLDTHPTETAGNPVAERYSGRPGRLAQLARAPALQAGGR